MKLSYLGAGYPLFYNWFKCCIFLLAILFVSSSCYNMVTNYQGSDCLSHSSIEKHLNKAKSNKICVKNNVTIFTLANKMTNQDVIKFQSKLAILTYILVMITLFIFRKIQRQINNDVDEKQITAGDYSIILKNFPNYLKNYNYEKEVKEIVEKCVPGVEIVVCNVNLAYDVTEITAIDSKIDSIVEEKKKILDQNGFSFEDPRIFNIDNEISLLKKKKSRKL